MSEKVIFRVSHCIQSPGNRTFLGNVRCVRALVLGFISSIGKGNRGRFFSQAEEKSKVDFRKGPR